MQADVVVLGAGGGGYPGAYRLARSGYTVVMADPKGELGGNCLYSGCVPSKTVRELAQTYWRAKKLLNLEGKVDFSLLQDHKDRVQEIRFRQHREELKEFPSLNFVKGVGEIMDRETIIIHSDEEDLEVKYRHLIIATGSEPVKPNVPGAEYGITSDELFGYRTNLRKLPGRIAIVGGGYIAVETASVLSALGYEVTILVRGERALRNVSQELANTLLSVLNLNISYNSPVLEVRKVKEDEYKVVYSKAGTQKELDVGLVLFATGRKPVLPKGVERLGVRVDSKGYIEVDEAMRTSVKGVYATGDVNGKAPYFHGAVRMSLAAAYNIMANGEPVDYVDYKAIPVTIYSIPSASAVGYTREELERMGVEFVEATYDMRKDVMAQIYDEMEGVMKLYFQKGSLRFLGGWIVGVHSGYVINELGQAFARGLTARDLANYADQHPATNELVAYTARKVL